MKMAAESFTVLPQLNYIGNNNNNKILNTFWCPSFDRIKTVDTNIYALL